MSILKFAGAAVLAAATLAPVAADAQPYGGRGYYGPRHVGPGYRYRRPYGNRRFYGRPYRRGYYGYGRPYRPGYYRHRGYRYGYRY